jgi:hypothetical protein
LLRTRLIFQSLARGGVEKHGSFIRILHGVFDGKAGTRAPAGNAVDYNNPFFFRKLGVPG